MTPPVAPDPAPEAGERDPPARSPALSCGFLTLVPLGLLLTAAWHLVDMLRAGRYDDWGPVVAPLVVLAAFPVVGLVVLRLNQKMFRQASEELERMAHAQDAPGEDER